MKHSQRRSSQGAGSVSSPAAPMCAQPWGHLQPLCCRRGPSWHQHQTRHPQRMEGRSQHHGDDRAHSPREVRGLGKGCQQRHQEVSPFGRAWSRHWLAKGLTSLIASPLTHCPQCQTRTDPNANQHPPRLSCSVALSVMEPSSGERH